MKLISKKELKLEHPADVYDIENTGSNNHNFCLGNGVVVHNCAKNPNFVYTSEEIINILSAIGYDPKLEDPLSKVQIGRMICLADGDEDGPISADTKVILCNGTIKSIGQLAKDWEYTQKPTWVWALDAQGNLHPAEAYAPQITCYKDKYAVVELDDGTKIKCTLNHKFAVNYTATTEHKADIETGVHYVAAKNLQPGDSIMSAYFKDLPLNGNKGNTNLYRHVQTNNTYSWSGNYYPLHKLVAAEAYPEKFEEYCAKNSVNKNSMAIHHKDHDRMNNTPSNLEIITSLEHTKDHHSFNVNGYNGSELQKQRLKEYHQSDKNRETTAALNKREDIKLLQNIGKYAKQSFNNHKVVSVTFKKLKEPKPFYCLTVPKYHNFLLADKNDNGICSSNCHINTLLLTLIFKVAPELFEKGMVYIADMPDFYATYKDQVAVGNSVSEVRQKLNAMKAPKSVEINHIKGWGEINSSLMKALAVDKATRKLIKIKALTDHDRVTFIRIMNDDVAYRRQMLGLSENV